MLTMIGVGLSTLYNVWVANIMSNVNDVTSSSLTLHKFILYVLLHVYLINSKEYHKVRKWQVK
jgi:hypothetical protein